MSTTSSTLTGGTWLGTLLSGYPHEIIGDPQRPYLKRWFLLPRNGWHNVYLHKFLRDDDPEDALHDHPWSFTSLLLWGRYRESTETGSRIRSAGTLAHRRAEHRHRITLLRDRRGREKPCYTIIVTGSRRRIWGFWCPAAEQPRFVPAEQFGPGGCGEPNMLGTK